MHIGGVQRIKWLKLSGILQRKVDLTCRGADMETESHDDTQNEHAQPSVHVVVEDDNH